MHFYFIFLNFPNTLLLFFFSVQHGDPVTYTCIFQSFFFCFLGPHSWHMEVPRLGVELELQLPGYATATETWDPSCICSLHHSSWQCQIPDLLSKARDRTCILMDTSLIHFCCATMETPRVSVFTDCLLLVRPSS